jgi:2-polyprenyl-3-methyl-5-hydroxy-6-metoxy-1,4-benzoquinol methylase
VQLAPVAPSETMHTPTETPNCPLCAANDPQPTGFAREPFHVVRCGNCRLWYLSPRLTADATDRLYRSNDYFSGCDAGYADYSSQERSLRTTFRRLLRTMAQSGMTGGRLLEVGAGFGYFLDEARDFYSTRTGIEMSSHAAAKAAEVSGATVLPGVEALGSDDRFDTIVALHVIEHVPDPVAWVRSLARRIAPGGVMVLATPDMGSFWRQAMGSRWPSFKYPEHLAFYDSATLPRLLEAAGLQRPVRLRYLDSFPMSEVLAKLGIGAPEISRRIDVPMPASTICFAAVQAGGESE